MEKETENQIINELKNISQSLESINIKLEESEKKPWFWLSVKSLLFGIFIVGPVIAVAMGIIMVISNWLFN